MLPHLVVIQNRRKILIKIRSSCHQPASTRMARKARPGQQMGNQPPDEATSTPLTPLLRSDFFSNTNARFFHFILGVLSALPKTASSMFLCHSVHAWRLSQSFKPRALWRYLNLSYLVAFQMEHTVDDLDNNQYLPPT